MTLREYLLNIDSYRLAEYFVKEKYDYSKNCTDDTGKSKYVVTTDGKRFDLVKTSDFDQAVQYQQKLIENYPGGIQNISDEELAEYLVKEDAFYESSQGMDIQNIVTTDQRCFENVTRQDKEKAMKHQVELLHSEDLGVFDL